MEIKQETIEWFKIYIERPNSTWYIHDADGHTIASGIPDEPTARLLAASWAMKNTLDEYLSVNEVGDWCEQIRDLFTKYGL